MKWCSNCKEEYEDFVERCAECGDELIPFPDKEEEIEDPIINTKLNLEFLSTSNSNIEAEIICALLNSAGIYTELSRKGSGSYLNIATGINYQGTDIYVNEDDYIEAKDILDAKASNFEEEAYVEEVSGNVASITSDEESFLQKRRIRMRLVIFGIMGIPMIFVFLSWIYDLLKTQ